MTTKNNTKYAITPAPVYSIAPQLNITEELTKAQQQIEEQTNTHLLKMQGYMEKTAYAARALPYVASVAASGYTQSGVYADDLNDSVKGTGCYEQVKTFNRYNLDLLQKNLYAVQDGLGNALYTEVQAPFKEETKKRGWFG